MIKNSDLKEGIQYCLDNGKGLLEDGRFLQTKKKYTSSIPLLILGYEEINKALFLEYKFHKDENITDREYKDLFKGGSHNLKNELYYKITKKKLEEISDAEYMLLKSVIESQSSITWHTSRDDAIKQIEGAIPLVSKFNDMKLKFLYVDFKNKWMKPHGIFKDKVLDNICTVLYYSALESYLKTMFHLDVDKMGLYNKVVERYSEEEKRVIQSKYSKELEKIELFFKTPQWRTALTVATRAIHSL